MKHVYAMQRADGAVKIGMSADPKQRQISVGREVKQSVDLMFSIPLRSDAREVEKIAHKLLLDKRETGEWFLVSVEEAMWAISHAVEIIEGRAPDITSNISHFPSTSRHWALSDACLDNMEPRNVRFPAPLLKKLEQMSKELGIKEPELIRRALDEFIQRWEASGGGK